MNAPRVSVITPSYNQGVFIEDTIKSVLSQDYNSIEYIVIDGNSTDTTLSVIQKYHKAINCFVSESDNGQAQAINKGLKIASGEYIMWLNSDDILLPGSISKAVSFFQCSPSVDVIHGHSILFGSAKSERVIGLDRGDWGPYYTAFMPFPQPSSLFSRRVIDKIGVLDESLHYGMDFDLYLRAYLVSDLHYVPHTFSRYRIHSESKSNHELLFLRDWREVFSRFINSMQGCKDLCDALLNAGLHTGTSLRYPVSRTFSRKRVEKSLGLHLKVLAHTAYQNGDAKLFSRAVDFLKIVLPDFYRSNRIFELEVRNALFPYRMRRLIKNYVS